MSVCQCSDLFVAFHQRPMQSPSTAELLLRIAAMSGPITTPQLPVATGARAEKRAATGSTKKAAIKRSKPVARGAGGLQWMDAPSTVTNDAQMEALTNPAAMASAARTAAGFQTQSASPAVGIARDGGGEKENAPPHRELLSQHSPQDACTASAQRTCQTCR